MGTRSYDQSAKEMYRVTYTLDGNIGSGNYASERITFGPRATGDSVQYFREFSALVEGPMLSGSQLELWLPRVSGSSLPESLTDADYFNTGITPMTGTFGRWQVSTWPGGQLRLKAGSGQGTVTISASGY